MNAWIRSTKKIERPTPTASAISARIRRFLKLVEVFQKRHLAAGITLVSVIPAVAVVLVLRVGEGNNGHAVQAPVLVSAVSAGWSASATGSAGAGGGGTLAACGLLALLFYPHLIFQSVPELVRGALELGQAAPQRFAQLRQLPWPEHKEGNQEDNDHFHHAD